jgi:hypothetical protein
MMFIRKAALTALLIAGAGIEAFAPNLVKSGRVLSLRLLATVEKDEAATDAPDHMPELREVAPTFDAKPLNTAFERYKSEYERSLSQNAQYWNERAQSLLSWDHYPYTPESCDGVITGGFHYGDVAWFSGAKLNVCFNAIDRHVQNGKADQVAMVSIVVSKFTCWMNLFYFGLMKPFSHSWYNSFNRFGKATSQIKFSS